MDIIPSAPVRIFGLPFEGFNVAPLLNAWLVMGVLVLLSYLACRSLSREPGRLQAAFELITEFFENICDSSLGEEHGRKYMPFIATLFLFVFLCNVIGIIPNFLWWAGWPGFIAPTQDLNTPLGLAILVLFVVHISAIRIKGFGEWLWGFYEPSFPSEGRAAKTVGLLSFAGGAVLSWWFVSGYLDGWPEMAAGKRAGLGALLALWLANFAAVTVLSFRTGRVPNAAMAPLNFVGEIGKAISHPFRLFGNIFGGFVIVVVVSNLIRYIGLPPFLNAFFGLFIGLVHAFVFAMLALAYTAVQIRD
ncbi:MAG: F0F1 ATP synthase subunit A [Planctomycetota bacterium]